jgi:cysteine-rich repeat protein
MITLVAPSTSSAGAFLFAGESNGVDVITHPPGYDGNPGVVEVTVCIEPGSPNAAEMILSLENAAATFSAMLVTTGNLSSGASNNVPSGRIDFESVLLHEVGHCLGLAHPNLASESGLNGSDRNYTKSTDGPSGTYDLDRSADLIRGSGDDLRGNDENLHWFRKADNNPFVIDALVDATTYSRQLADLPGGDTFAANGDRGVASGLGFNGSEAIMQQGTFTDEAQRSLTADDVATLRLAMAGVNQVIGGGDDYTLQLTSLGITSVCDIVVEFDDSQTDFAQCNVTGSYLSFPDHIVIESPRIYFNDDSNWFFNPPPITGCGSGSLDPGEGCDDAGHVDGDGCDASCQVETGWSCAGEPSVCDGICGDSLVRGSEACDDGGFALGDGCDAVCEEVLGWTCTGEPSSCVTTCGDGVVVGTEECDDANGFNADGCKNNCTIRIGWACTGWPSACSGICGDTLVVGDEFCDDGGTEDGDCCSSICLFEGLGSACDDDANTCTDDVCDGAGICIHPFNLAPCDDGDACTMADQCAAGACAPGPPLDCDDGLFCNGVEVCSSPSGCVPGVLDVDDGVACTVDGCDEGTDTITHAPDDLSCEDADACTAGSCDAVTGCAYVPIEACEAAVPGLGAWSRLLVSLVILTIGILAVGVTRRRI